MINLLSNFLLRGDGRGQGEIECRPAGEEEMRPALRMVLGCDDEEQIGDFVRFSGERNVDIRLLWVAARGRQLLWSALPVVSPGHTVLLLSAQALGAIHQQEAAEALIRRMCEQFASRDIHLAQALLDPHQLAARKIYESCGFTLMAELEYLQTIVRNAPECPLPAGLLWRDYSAASHGQFVRTINSTYEGSLDCPALNGVRDMEDVLAGHKAAGPFDPKLWFLLEDADGAPLGTLLLSRTPLSDSVELIYLGLPPRSRGKGIGDLLMRKALRTVAEVGRMRLTLAVDSRNRPALKLYHRHGLQRICGKVAMMKDLREDAAARGIGGN